MKRFLVLLISLFMITGCFGENTSTDQVAYTTYYPIEYATKYMYKDFCDVSSIYPGGADIDNYTLTEKQEDIYSKADYFVYAGVSDEVNLAVKFLNTNAALKIIDATKGLNFNQDIVELWLDPSNYLMIARNVKSTLEDYENNVYNQNTINELYDELKIKISELDVEFTMMGKNATRKTLLVTDDTFNFLSKYGLNIISLDKDNTNITKNYNDAKDAISKGDVTYIYTLGNKELSEDVETFITDNNLTKLEIDPLYTLSDEHRRNNDDYISVMEDNISKFKTELFR